MIKYSGSITFNGNEWKCIRPCPHCNRAEQRHEVRLGPSQSCPHCESGFQVETRESLGEGA